MDAYNQHVVTPLFTVRNELFQTFRQKRSIVSVEDFEADKESLVRMLQDFRKDNASSKLVTPRPPPSTPARWQSSSKKATASINLIVLIVRAGMRVMEV
jgi:hypothetical protein